MIEKSVKTAICRSNMKSRYSIKPNFLAFLILSNQKATCKTIFPKMEMCKILLSLILDFTLQTYKEKLKAFEN